MQISGVPRLSPKLRNKAMIHYPPHALEGQFRNNILFYSLYLLLAAVMLVYPDMTVSVYADTLATANRTVELSELTTGSFGSLASFGGSELGDATWVLFNTLSEIIFPFAAIAAGVFGLFALVRGFNIAVIGGAFAVAIAAGLMPNLLLSFSGYTEAALF